MAIDELELAEALEAWHAEQARSLCSDPSSIPPTSMGHQRLGGERRSRFHTSFVVAQGPREPIDGQLATSLERCLEELAEQAQAPLVGTLSRHTPPKAARAPRGSQRLEYHLFVDTRA